MSLIRFCRLGPWRSDHIVICDFHRSRGYAEGTGEGWRDTVVELLYALGCPVHRGRLRAHLVLT